MCNVEHLMDEEMVCWLGVDGFRLDAQNANECNECAPWNCEASEIEQFISGQMGKKRIIFGIAFNTTTNSNYNNSAKVCVHFLLLYA